MQHFFRSYWSYWTNVCTIKLSWKSVAHFFKEITLRDKGLNFIKNASSRHTKVTELKVEQLTSLDNGIFTENICTFDEKKVKKYLTS